MAGYGPIIVLILCHVISSRAGTRMLEPPSRASLWRYGYNTPVNNFDDKTDCGGYERHYLKNGGNCGVCGDPSDEPAPRRHEAGGEQAPNPRPVRAFQAGSYVTVVIETSSSLFGKFQFRLCKIPDSMSTPNQTCFDEHLLPILEAELGTEYQIGSRQGIHLLNVQLPTGMLCEHCILQWKHVTGFTTNQDSCQTCPGGLTRCHMCKGCGNQVWYVGCTDIALYAKYQFPPSLVSTPGTAGTSVTSATATSTNMPDTLMTSSFSQCTCPYPDPRDNLINQSLTYPSHVSSTTVSPLSRITSGLLDGANTGSSNTNNNNNKVNNSKNTTTINNNNVTSNRSVTVSTPTPVTKSSTSQVTPTTVQPTGDNSPTRPRLRGSSGFRPARPTTPSPNTQFLKTSPPPPPLVSTRKSTSSSGTGSQTLPDGERKPDERETCYVTNKNRYPKGDFDLWCRQNCPEMGEFYCSIEVCSLSQCTPANPSSSTSSHITSRNPFSVTSQSYQGHHTITRHSQTQPKQQRTSTRPHIHTNSGSGNTRHGHHHRNNNNNWLSWLPWLLLGGDSLEF